MHEKIEHHLDRGLRILDGDCLGRIVADASLATKEKHGDWAKLRHRHGVMTGSAWQCEDAMPLACERRRQSLHQGFVARRGFRLVKRREAYVEAAFLRDGAQAC